jgi:hypothetical protein
MHSCYNIDLIQGSGNFLNIQYLFNTVMVFNATFNNILTILWWSVLLVEDTGVPGENIRPVASHLQTLSRISISNFPVRTTLLLYTLR